MTDIVHVSVFTDRLHVKLTDGQRSLLKEYLDAHSLCYHAAYHGIIVVHGKPGQLYKLLVEMSWMYPALLVN